MAPGLRSGSLIRLLTLVSFSVFPLPTHHEKSKLSVNLEATFKVKDSFTALSTFLGTCCHLELVL